MVIPPFNLDLDAEAHPSPPSQTCNSMLGLRDRKGRCSQQKELRRWAFALLIAACLLLSVFGGNGGSPSWPQTAGSSFVTNHPQRDGPMDPSPVALGAIPIGAPGYEPRALAVDSATGLAFVGLYPTYLDVVSLSDEHVITTINLGANESPTQAAVDNQTGVVYVTTGSHYVIAVSEASSTIIARISVGQYPSGIAYDWENGYIYTANFRSSNLSVIDTTTNTVVHTFEVLPFPQAVTFDPVADRLIVMGVDGFNPWGWASSIDLSNYTAVWTWYPMLPQQQGSAGPFKATVDLRDGDVYATWVTSAGIPSVLVLSARTAASSEIFPSLHPPPTSARESSASCTRRAEI